MTTSAKLAESLAGVVLPSLKYLSKRFSVDFSLIELPTRRGRLNRQ